MRKFTLILSFLCILLAIWVESKLLNRIEKKRAAGKTTESRNTAQPYSNDNRNITNKKNRYHMLFWRQPWDDPYIGLPEEGKEFGSCVITYDKKLLKHALVVMFHHTTFDYPPGPRKLYYRDKDQIYVWYTWSSPAYIKEHDKINFEKSGRSFFNWKFTFRRDSDVQLGLFEGTKHAHEWMRSLKGQNQKNTLKYHNFRHLKPSVGNSLAVWAVSDCNKTDGARKRMKLVEDLMQAGLKVDLYGACFHRRQTDIDFNPYKFYLAFENSYHCRDYVTEKFWFNSVKNLSVPVVWGPAKEDLEDLAPKGSYIFVEDFASPADLVKYLIYLDNNVAAYLEYFRWLEDPELVPNYMKQQSRIDYFGFEELCQKARANTETKVIDDIAEYWFGTEREECLVSEEE